jgi:hypothetical protein
MDTAAEELTLDRHIGKDVLRNESMRGERKGKLGSVEYL